MKYKNKYSLKFIDKIIISETLGLKPSKVYFISMLSFTTKLMMKSLTMNK